MQETNRPGRRARAAVLGLALSLLLPACFAKPPECPQHDARGDCIGNTGGPRGDGHRGPDQQEGGAGGYVPPHE